MKVTTSKRKTPAANKSNASNKTLLLKKQPSQIKKTKVPRKKIDGAVSIKEKLAGKNYSPVVEKAKIKNKQSALTTSPHVKQKFLPNKNKANVKKLEKPEIKSAAETVEEKRKFNSVKKVKSIEIKEDTHNAGTKRKSDVVKSNVSSKASKKVKKDVKDCAKNQSIAAPPEVKKEDNPLPTKSPRQSKKMRKSSVSKIEDLKPISNIRSLAKKPQNKVSKVKLMKKEKKTHPERGVCYFSHIPHGFYEKELNKYCSQFGKVTGVYHPVSKLGNSRGYAFVEFEHKEVAEVVAETMNNYLMFNRLVKCVYIPPESQRPWIFRRERNNMKVANERRKENLDMQMRNLSNPEAKKWKKKRLHRIKSLHNKLTKLGVDYEFQVNNSELKEVKEKVKKEIKSEN